jgi:NAD(P)-dependent dehydrogenase (short-subunit alcohol dehydrogenase family)
MKIGITGHSRGLGLALANKLSANNQIIGFSRSNGYNIAHVHEIIKDALDCDMFINNAYNNYYQSDLLLYLFRLWQDNPNKSIVNIGSTVTTYPRIETEIDHLPWAYRDHKIALERLFRHLVKQTHKCHMLLVAPGAIDTDMIAHHNGIKASADQVADIIIDAISKPLIKEITIYEQ